MALRLSDRGFTSSRGLSYTFSGTATELDTALPITHNLGALPSSLELWVEVSAGQWEQQDAATYVTASTTALTATATTLASVVGGSTNVRLVAAAGAVALSVAEAASGVAGIIGGGGSQTLSPALTLEGALTLSGGATSSSESVRTVTTSTSNFNYVPLFERTGTADAGLRTSIVCKATTSVPMLDTFGPAVAFVAEDDAVAPNTLGFVGAVRAGADNSGSVVIHTANAGVVSEKFIVSPAGNVGIGTASPDTLFHISAQNFSTTNVNNVFRITDTDTSISIPQTIGKIEFESLASGTPGVCGEIILNSNGSATVPSGEFTFNVGTPGSLVQGLNIAKTGAVTLGPSSGGGIHSIQSGPGAGTQVLSIDNTTSSATRCIARYATENTTKGYLGFDSSNNLVVLNNSGSTVTSMSSAGAWTLGPSSGSDVTHTVNGIGGTTTNEAMRVLQLNSTADYPALLLIKANNTNGTTNKIIKARRGGAAGTDQGAISFDGGTQLQFTTYSDERLKENFRPAPAQLPKILAMNIQLFDMKSGSAQNVFGATAQNLQECFPEHVSSDENGILEVGGWGTVEYRLAKAIQELNAKVEALEAQLGSGN